MPKARSTLACLSGRYLPTPGGSVVNNLPAMQEMRIRSLGQEDLLQKDMATRSCILAWEISWIEEPGRLQSIGLQKSYRHNWVTKQQLEVMVEFAYTLQPWAGALLVIHHQVFDLFWTWLLATSLATWLIENYLIVRRRLMPTLTSLFRLVQHLDQLPPRLQAKPQAL